MTYLHAVKLHCKKRLAIFPSPVGMSVVTNKLSLVGNNLSFVSDIPAGDGKIGNLFYSVAMLIYESQMMLQLKTVMFRTSVCGCSARVRTQPMWRTWVKSSTILIRYATN
jgi:hypothetical protein